MAGRLGLRTFQKNQYQASELSQVHLFKVNLFLLIQGPHFSGLDTATIHKSPLNRLPFSISSVALDYTSYEFQMTNLFVKQAALVKRKKSLKNYPSDNRLPSPSMKTNTILNSL